MERAHLMWSLSTAICVVDKHRHSAIGPQVGLSGPISLLPAANPVVALQNARQSGVQRLVLLTTRTADWFEQRDFKLVGECRAQLRRQCSVTKGVLSLLPRGFYHASHTFVGGATSRNSAEAAILNGVT